MEKIIKFVATGFGISRFAPHPGEGTVGTLVGVAIFAVWPDSRLHPKAYWLLILLGTAIGIYIAGEAEKIFGQKDCPLIVVDEIAGFMVSMAFLPKTFTVIAVAFIIFRILDGLKIKPIKSLEKLAGGFGVMGDDIAAGLITNFIMHIVVAIFF